ncbi:hypothetical protein MRB53_003586 [Persea americana]|uniref:Uncharacterized protein n=1 Tax=Persea americana TaxID=3435 RepID=A0ACC2MYP5_PERAE|nr:hypothetical protein MRB53_003586 [Persea americana]|eukprot:TRINITY_DN3640_c0_g1_i1.p1 TRINITY_DN3640_c0_g1~~TRINITY_DN3640_c0_g1_i1.p1  ORF type:complete len:135 (-),score=29.65 TRINITY_DN3640_c0_g1_i1:512-916(-)
MAANLQRRGFISFGKRFLQTNSISVFRDPSPLVSDAASRSRHFSVTPYDKNVDDGLSPTSVPDDGVDQHIDKFWVPHPQTGVFGPSKEIGGENQTQPPPPNLETDADAADGSVLDQKARFRPLEDVDKPINNLE